MKHSMSANHQTIFLYLLAVSVSSSDDFNVKYRSAADRKNAIRPACINLRNPVNDDNSNDMNQVCEACTRTPTNANMNPDSRDARLAANCRILELCRRFFIMRFIYVFEQAVETRC